MWSADMQQLSSGQVLKFKIDQNSSPMTLEEVLRGWSQSQDFRLFFIELLARTPFPDFRWETPPSTTASLPTPFEFVVVNSPGLAQFPDAASFAGHFSDRTSDEAVVCFPNLSRDAVLVVPCPIAPRETYRHLGAFLRGAPEKQKHALWKTIGTEMASAIAPSPVWLSTAGAGVSWLHVRIDQRPKYYAYGPYRKHNREH